MTSQMRVIAIRKLVVHGFCRCGCSRSGGPWRHNGGNCKTIPPPPPSFSQSPNSPPPPLCGRVPIRGLFSFQSPFLLYAAQLFLNVCDLVDGCPRNSVSLDHFLQATDLPSLRRRRFLFASFRPPPGSRLWPCRPRGRSSQAQFAARVSFLFLRVPEPSFFCRLAVNETLHRLCIPLAPI